MDSKRIARLEALFAARHGDVDAYGACTDGELLELAAEVVADARQNPGSYSNDAGRELLEQIAKINRGHAPQGE